MNNELLIQVQSLQNLLIARATDWGKSINHNEQIEKQRYAEYVQLRQTVLSNSELDKYVPVFIKTCRDLNQFWNEVKAPRFTSYAERREFIYREFEKLLNFIEFEYGKKQPSDLIVNTVVEKFDAEHIHNAWQKALDRRTQDPEGAITSARTLIESTCKYILDNADVKYDDSMDLPKLYKLTAEVLNIAPSQHTEEVFKQILGGCSSIIQGLGTLRNRLSDAHGKPIKGVKPAVRHAELAVNLSGSMASFLLATWEYKQTKS